MMSMSERGRLGGKATFAKYGAAHMSKIGKAGFRRLCCKFLLNSRRRALEHLHAKGRMKARYIKWERTTPEQQAALWEQMCEYFWPEDGHLPDPSEPIPF